MKVSQCTKKRARGEKGGRGREKDGGGGGVRKEKFTKFSISK